MSILSGTYQEILERLTYEQMYIYILVNSSLIFNAVFIYDRKPEGGHDVAVLTELSKTSDCIMFDLLTVKLQAYCFDGDS